MKKHGQCFPKTYHCMEQNKIQLLNGNARLLNGNRKKSGLVPKKTGLVPGQENIFQCS